MAAQTDKGAVDGRVSRCELDETTPISTNVVITNHCIKQPIRKIKPIPPPLDLSKRGPLDLTSSESVGECFSASFSILFLPYPHSWCEDFVEKAYLQEKWAGKGAHFGQRIGT